MYKLRTYNPIAADKSRNYMHNYYLRRLLFLNPWRQTDFMCEKDRLVDI